MMDFQIGIGGFSSRWISGISRNGMTSYSCSSPLKPRCSKGDPQQNDDRNSGNNGGRDWDKAWSKFKKQSKKSLFSKLSFDQYITWNPKRSKDPPSEVDPIKRTERSVLMLWTSPRFTLIFAILTVSILLIYTLQAPLE